MDKVVHFEIPAEDMKRAEEFYTKTFQWKVKFIPQFNYAIIHTVKVDEKQMPKEPGAINGGMLKRKEPIIHPIITVSVNDIDEAAKQIEKNGGKIVMPKLKVGDMGYSAYFKDTEGNILGIWQSLK
ncbi:VOC family protein [Candidatus Woesearchaeota archaeon]|nr:VOC family protein [Candidatus Woesearchaeota archaeon]